MKLGLFETEDLVIYKKQELLAHKPTGIAVEFIKTDNERETLINFGKALKELELRVGLLLIDNSTV